MADNDVLIRIRADTGQIISAVGQVDNRLSSFAGSAQEHLKRSADAAEGLNRKLASMGHGLLALAGAGGGLRGLASLADQFTTLQARLALATEGLGSTADAYRRLYGIAQETRAPVAELSNIFGRLAEAGKVLNVSQDRLLSVTQTIGKAMAVSGGSADSMRAAIVQLGQGLASGTLRGEELNSVLEQAPRLAQAIADGLGVTRGALREMGQEGKLSAEQLIAALENAAASVERDFAKIPLTVGGALQQLQNKLLDTVGQFDKLTGASQSLAGAIKAVADNADIAIAAAGTLTATGLVAFFTSSSMGAGLLAGALAALSAPISGATALVVGLGSALLVLWSRMRQGETDIDKAREKLQYLRDQLAKGADNQMMAAAVRAQRDIVAGLELEIQARQEQAGIMRGLDGLRRQELNSNKKLAADTEILTKLQRAAAGQSADFGVTLAELHRLYQTGVIPSTEEYRRQVEALIDREGGGRRITQEYTAALKGQAEAWKKIADAMRESEMARLKSQADTELAKSKALREQLDALAAARQKELDALLRKASTAEDTVQRLEDEAQAAALAATGNISLAEAIERVAIARLENHRAALLEEGTNESASAAAVLEREIAAREKIIGLLKDRSGREAASEHAKAASDEWSKSAQTIEQSLTDALMRGFESGKDFGRNLRDTLVNLFKTLVLRPIIQPVAQSAAGGLLGLLGMGAPGVAGAAGGASGAGGFLSGVGGIGSLLGGTGSFASGLMSLQSPAAAFNQFLLGGSGAQLLGAATPYAAAAYALYSIISGKGTGRDRTPAAASYGGAEIDALGSIFATDPRSRFWGDTRGLTGVSGDTQKALTALLGTVSGLAKSLGGSAGGLRAYSQQSYSTDSGTGVVGLDLTNALGKSFAANSGNIASGDLAKAFGEQLQKAVLAGLQLADLPTQFKDYFAQFDISAMTAEQAAAAIEAATSAQQLIASLQTLGFSLSTLPAMTVDAANTLASMFGGVQGAVSAIGGAYGILTSEQTKLADSTTLVNETFAALNLAIPATGDELWRLMQGLDLTTDSGQQALAALLQVSPAFMAVTSAAESAAAAAIEQARAQAEATAESERAFAEMMGGITGGLRDAWSMFATEEQQLARTTEELTATFAAFNVAVPKTDAEMLSLIQSIDLTTESGRALAQAVISSASALDYFISAIGATGAAAVSVASSMASAVSSAVSAAVSASSSAFSMDGGPSVSSTFIPGGGGGGGGDGGMVRPPSQSKKSSRGIYGNKQHLLAAIVAGVPMNSASLNEYMVKVAGRSAIDKEWYSPAEMEMRKLTASWAGSQHWNDVFQGPAGGYLNWRLFPDYYNDRLSSGSTLAGYQFNANENILNAMLFSRFATRESVEWALQQLFYSQNEYRRAYQGLAVRFRNEGINVDGWKANLNYNLKGMFGNPQVSWQYNGPDQSGSYGMSGPERTFTGAITYNNLRTAPRGPIPNTILSNAGA